jgi:hypothetical protein
MRALFILLLALPLVPAAKGGEPHVFTLEGVVSFSLAEGWTYVQKGKHGLVGPEGAPVAEIAYVELELNQPSPIRYSDAVTFVRNNLKVATCENLDGDRALGHIIQRDGEVEHHRWNVATVIDGQHIAVLLIDMDTRVDNQKIASVVDELARSARFLPHKPKT